MQTLTDSEARRATIVLELPFPPSVNTYWRRNGSVYFISKAGKAFQKNVYATLAKLPGLKAFPPTARLAVKVELHPPDRRARDIDNSLKGLIDSLVKGGVMHDDEQIDDLRIVRCRVEKGGSAVVRIRRIGSEIESLGEP